MLHVQILSLSLSSLEATCEQETNKYTHKKSKSQLTQSHNPIHQNQRLLTNDKQRNQPSTGSNQHRPKTSNTDPYRPTSTNPTPSKINQNQPTSTNTNQRGKQALTRTN